jgi:hypothetical protein
VAIEMDDAPAEHEVCDGLDEGVEADGVSDAAARTTGGGASNTGRRSEGSRHPAVGQRPPACRSVASLSRAGDCSEAHSACVSAVLASGAAQVLHRHYADDELGSGIDSAARSPKPMWRRTSHSISVLHVRRALQMARDKLAIPGGATRENVAVEEMLALAFEQLTGGHVTREGELIVPEEVKVRLFGPELAAAAGDSGDGSDGGSAGGPPRQSQRWLCFEAADALADTERANAESECGGTAQPRQSLLAGTADSADTLAAPSIPSRKDGPLSTVGPAGGGWEASLRSPVSACDTACTQSASLDPAGIGRLADRQLSINGPAGGGWEASLRSPVTEGVLSPVASISAQRAIVDLSGPRPAAEARPARTAGRGAASQSKDAAGEARLVRRMGRTLASIPAASGARAFAGEGQADSLCSGSALPVRPRATGGISPQRLVPVSPTSPARARIGVRMVSPCAVVLFNAGVSAPLMQTVKRIEPKSRKDPNASSRSPTLRALSPVRHINLSQGGTDVAQQLPGSMPGKGELDSSDARQPTNDRHSGRNALSPSRDRQPPGAKPSVKVWVVGSGGSVEPTETVMAIG